MTYCASDDGATAATNFRYLSDYFANSYARGAPTVKEPNVTMAWITAGKVLGIDPAASVLCPVCGKANLVVQDIVDKKNSNKFERIMSCPNCGSRNILLMSKKN
jgi:predicted RNA-binding Zn-ribbon protein involved in translation (DUF1610 family)